MEAAPSSGSSPNPHDLVVGSVIIVNNRASLVISREQHEGSNTYADLERNRRLRHADLTRNSGLDDLFPLFDPAEYKRPYMVIRHCGNDLIEERYCEWLQKCSSSPGYSSNTTTLLHRNIEKDREQYQRLERMLASHNL